MKTIFEMASEIKRDPRTHTLHLRLTSSSNDSYTAPEDFYFEAEWGRESVPHPCGHRGHVEHPRSFRAQGKKSAEEAIQKIYALHLLSNNELEIERNTGTILYHDGDFEAYDAISWSR